MIGLPSKKLAASVTEVVGSKDCRKLEKSAIATRTRNNTDATLKQTNENYHSPTKAYYNDAPFVTA
jgi:hypothetical protein